MWESIAVMVTSRSFIPFLVFLGVIVIILVVGVRKGIIKFNTRVVSIGTTMDTERNIICTQIRYVESTVEDFYKQLGYKQDDWKARFITDKVQDVLINAVAINHINDSPMYLKLKQADCWKPICMYSDQTTPELHKKVDDAVASCISELIKIRRYLTNDRM